jgi:hypothetical protein
MEVSMKWTGSLVFLLAAGAGALVPGRSPSPPPPAHLEAAPAAGQLEAELELTGIKASEGGETAELELALAHGFKTGARATYLFEVRDDHGRLVGAKQQATPFALDAGGARVVKLESGALPAGFYRATVTAAARSGEERALATNEVYLESRDGELIPLEFSDFADRSAYNAGVFE